jgi:hypothetical protein
LKQRLSLPGSQIEDGDVRLAEIAAAKRVE